MNSYSEFRNNLASVVKTPSCTVVVPVYKQLTSVERVVLAHNARLLRKYPFVLIGPSNAISSKEEAHKLLTAEDVDVVIGSFPDKDFASISGYNTLLKSHRFLDAFGDTDFILICQLDAVILSDELEKWLSKGFDFVGAPHFKGYSTPKMPPRFIPGANGGLSLRNISASRRALDKVRVVNKTAWSKFVVWTGLPWLTASLFQSNPWLLAKPNVNEDIFWSVLMPSAVSDYRVAPPQIAAKFAFEVLPQHLFEINSKILPFGCHAWQRYDQEFWLTKFPPKLSADLREVIGAATNE